MENRPILVRSIVNCDCVEIKRYLDNNVPRFIRNWPTFAFDLAFPNFQENDDDVDGFFLQENDWEEEDSVEEMPLEEDRLPADEHVCIQAHPDDFLVEYRALLQIGNVYKRVILVGIYRFADVPEPEPVVVEEESDSASDIEE